MPVTIDISYVLHLRKELMKINKLDLTDINWVDKGRPVEVDPKVVEEFQFLGLNNTDFIAGQFYRMKDTIYGPPEPLTTAPDSPAST